MQNQFADLTDLIKKFLGDPSSIILRKDRSIVATEEKRVHVQLVDQLTRMIRVIDTQPAVLASCEEARFIVANAPLGTVPAGKQILIKAIKQLELVQSHEPQVRYPLTVLKPLVRAYLSQ